MTSTLVRAIRVGMGLVLLSAASVVVAPAARADPIQIHEVTVCDYTGTCPTDGLPGVLVEAFPEVSGTHFDHEGSPGVFYGMPDLGHAFASATTNGSGVAVITADVAQFTWDGVDFGTRNSYAWLRYTPPAGAAGQVRWEVLWSGSEAGVPLKRVEFLAQPLFRGLAKDPDATVLQNATVTAVELDASGTPTSTVLGTTHTDSSGHFELSWPYLWSGGARLTVTPAAGAKGAKTSWDYLKIKPGNASAAKVVDPATALPTGTPAGLCLLPICDLTWTVDAADDTDGDGLPDAWEEKGVDVDGNGSIDVPLPAMGADKNHKDVFVEVDWMYSEGTCQAILCSGVKDFSPNAEALGDVVDAFEAAPVANPDGTTGIRVHIDSGFGSPMNPVTNATWGPLSRANAVPWVEHLGTIVNGNYDWGPFGQIQAANFDAARAKVFHYVLFADQYANVDSSGLARGIPSADLLVTDGLFNGGNGFTRAQERGTFMHELGHTLGLHHGGADDVNWKPDYASIMNYQFQFVGTPPNGTPDYSRGLPFVDWDNLTFKGGSIGAQGTPAPPPDLAPVVDDLDQAVVLSHGALAADGDAALSYVGPDFLIPGTGIHDLRFRITNAGSTDDTVTLTLMGGSPQATGTATVPLAAGASVVVALPVSTAGLAAASFAISARLDSSTAGTGVAVLHRAIDVLDLSDPATLQAVKDALAAVVAGAAPALDPALLADLQGMLTTGVANAADATAPIASMTLPTAAFQTTQAVALAWRGTDAGSGVASYDVRYTRVSARGGTTSAWITWKVATAATAASFPASLGNRYCYSVRARDVAGNVSAWSPSRCTSTPLDDRSLVASRGWVRGTGSGWLGGTTSTTTGMGASLTSATVAARQVGIIATTCRTCGSVAVYVGRTKVGTVSLFRSRTTSRTLIVLTRFTSLRSGAIRLVTLTKGKLVRVDGIVSSTG